MHGWIDYRIAYDNVPLSWILKTLQIYRFNEKLHGNIYWHIYTMWDVSQQIRSRSKWDLSWRLNLTSTILPSCCAINIIKSWLHLDVVTRFQKQVPQPAICSMWMIKVVEQNWWRTRLRYWIRKKKSKFFICSGSALIALKLAHRHSTLKQS